MGISGGEMKIRRLLAIAAILAGYLLFVSCGKKTPSLNLLVWEGYADPSFVRGFEDQYRCKISASYMGSSDELVAKLRGGSAGNYDVISPSSDVATSIAAAGFGGALDRPQNACQQRASPQPASFLAGGLEWQIHGRPFARRPQS